MHAAQIDLRYAGDNEGELSVVVAPVLRFLDVGFNANVRIEVCYCIGQTCRLNTGILPRNIELQRKFLKLPSVDCCWALHEWQGMSRCTLNCIAFHRISTRSRS